VRAVQVSFYADAQRRDADALLRAWPTLPAVAAATRRAGVDVVVVQAAHRPQTVERDSVAYHFVDDDRGMPRRVLPGVALPRRPARLFERIASLKPHVIHVHGLNYPLAVRQLTRALPRVPVLLQDHYTPVPRGWGRMVWRWAYGSVAAVSFTAREQAAPFVAARALRADLPVFDIVEGSSGFSPGSRDEARRTTGMFGDPCVFWAGRLHARKDPLTTLAAFERAATRLPDARLWCCFADAPLLDRVRRRIEQSPVLRQRVTLVGRRPHIEMELRFRAADFFVQTSRDEGSGYALIEAMSCGTPPLATDIPAARRIIGPAGSLTPVGDAAALAEAIVDWSHRDRARIREAARQRFEQALSFDVIGRGLRDAYESLVRAA
jgi:glycosyltransferase involved in cell wall biosynthesis